MASSLSEETIVFEEELQRNPFSLKTWLAFLESQRSAPRSARLTIYERALAQLPGSYKLWHAFLLEAVQEVSPALCCAAPLRSAPTLTPLSPSLPPTSQPSLASPSPSPSLSWSSCL